MQISCASSVIAAVVCITGCASATPTRPGPSAESLEYYLPQTSVALTEHLVLRQCDADGVLAEGTIAVLAKAVADRSHPLILDGEKLKTTWKKRSVKITLADNGTISGIDGAVEDRTGSVITNIFKIVGSLAGAAAVPGVAAPAAAAPGASVPAAPAPSPPVAKPTPCNQITQDALSDIKAMRTGIDALRKDLRMSEGPKSGQKHAGDAGPEKIAKKIDALAAQIGQIESNQLTLDLSTDLTLPNSASPANSLDIRWSIADTSKWFSKDDKAAICEPVASSFFDTGSGCDRKTSLFALSYSWGSKALSRLAELDNTHLKPCPPGQDDPGDANKDLKKQYQKKVESCAYSIVVVDPAAAALTISSNSENFIGAAKGDALKTDTYPISQWGDLSYLTLDDGFGGSSTISMNFDAFGRKTAFGLTSDAKAENMTGALSGILDAASTATSTARKLFPSSDSRMTAETQKLQDELNYNKMLACKAAIQAGATSCPTASN